MSVSKYLPPFTRGERVSAASARAGRTDPTPTSAAAAAPSSTDPEVTYADFLGDESPEVAR